MQFAKPQNKNLQIWENSSDIVKEFFCFADKLENLNLKKYSEYLRGLCLHISENLFEISNRQSKEDMTRLLTNNHFLVLEAENTMMIFCEQGIIDSQTNKRLIQKLNRLHQEIKKYLIVPNSKKNLR